MDFILIMLPHKCREKCVGYVLVLCKFQPSLDSFPRQETNSTYFHQRRRTQDCYLPSSMLPSFQPCFGDKQLSLFLLLVLLLNLWMKSNNVCRQILKQKILDYMYVIFSILFSIRGNLKNWNFFSDFSILFPRHFLHRNDRTDQNFKQPEFYHICTDFPLI